MSSFPKHITEAEAQAEELIKARANAPAETHDEIVVPDEATGQEQQSESVEQVAQPAPAEHVEPAKVDPNDYKERFIRYKSSTDQTIHGLRQQVAAKDASIADLMQRMAAMEQAVRQAQAAPQEQSVKSILSQEDMDRFDEDDLRVISKVAQAQAGGAVQALQQQVAQLRQQLAATETRALQERHQQLEQAAHRQQQTFIEKLTAKVPNLHEIDADPEFALWLDDVDPDSGRRRRDLAVAAMQQQDIRRVVDVYQEWTGTKRPADPRQRSITPRQAPVAASPNTATGQLWNRAKVEAFYQAWQKGKYSDAEAQAIERDMFAAQRDGRFT